jgi:hypothetical protein
MTLNKFPVAGGVISNATTWINNNTNTLLRQSGRNTIRQLIDRDVSLSATGGEWAEAYIDSNGRLNSVDTASTTALQEYHYQNGEIFRNTYFVPGFVDDYSSDTTHDPSSLTNPENAFDGDDSTYASIIGLDSTATSYLGKTFSSKYVYAIKYRTYVSANSGAYGDVTFDIETYDGSSWTSIYSYTKNNNGDETIYGTQIVDDTIEGIRIKLYHTDGNTGGNHKFYSIEYGYLNTASEIIHDLPSGSFSSTINGSFGTVLIEDWETGADIQYKLTNSTEDTGWLDYNEVSEFTAFTSEPTTCIVKLVPKSSSPTAGYPSIKGFYLVE